MDTDLEVRPKIAETVEIDPIVPDLRPKGRGRPQRILLGQWPEDHVREVIRAVVFREGELSSVSSHGPGHTASPPAPTSSPQNFPGTSGLEHQPPTKTEPQDPSSGGHGEAAGGHPLAAESRAAQAAFEAQMKQFYNNPFASQLLVASSKMFSNIDLNPFLQTSVKVEAPDEDTFEDAEAQEKARSEAERGQDRGQERGQERGQDRGQDRAASGPVDLATHSNKSIDAIASKLVRDVEGEEINDNVFNCSEEIRKTLRNVGDKETPASLVAACSQDQKSV